MSVRIRSIVKPRRVWQVSKEKVMTATVVEHHVLHHFESMGMCVSYKGAIVFVRAVAWVNAVIVRNGIA